LHGQQIWSTDDLGEHALFIRAYDRSGQSTQSSTLTVRVVKNVAPEVTLLNISAGDQIQSGQTIPVAIQASASQGVTLIQLFIDGKLYSSWESANPAGVSEITVSLEWKSPSLGRHVIHITAEDKVGNSTTTQSIRVTIVKAQATPTQTSKPTATRTAKPGTPTPTKKPTRTPTGKPTTAIPPTATHTPVASTEPTHVPTLPATVTSSSTPTRTPPPTTPPTTEPSAIPTASATPSATSQATTEPTAIPAATDTPIPVGPDQLIGKWSGTAQPSGDRWDMEFISSDSGISGTLALQPQSGEVLTGTLTSVALQGDEVRLTASFPSPGAEVAPKAASTARALSFINFNGKINSDGQLAGEWQGSDGSRGTVTLDRVEAVRLAAPLANPKVAGATPQAQQPVQNQNGLQNTTQNNPQNTPQNYLVPGLALAGALIVILAGIWFLRRRRRL
jgi:hypothetical protein